MSTRMRALLIGLAGPATQAVGIAWEAFHLAAVHMHSALTPRHIAFETGFLIILVGFLITLVCVPLALEVSQAAPEEVILPQLGAGPDERDYIDPERRILGRAK